MVQGAALFKQKAIPGPFFPQSPVLGPVLRKNNLCNIFSNWTQRDPKGISHYQDVLLIRFYGLGATLFCYALPCWVLLCIALLWLSLLCCALLCFALLCFGLHCFALHSIALLCIRPQFLGAFVHFFLTTFPTNALGLCRKFIGTWMVKSWKSDRNW